MELVLLKLQDTDNRFNMQTMTINSADTWEKKSITYTGDTSGTLNL